MKETYLDLLADLGLQENHQTPSMEDLIKSGSKYVRDLRMNLKTVLTKNSNLTKKESYLIALAVASNEKHAILTDAFKAKAIENEATIEEVAEAVACASLLSANNVFYRFRHYMEKESYETMRAGLRMNIMAKPVLGKEFFELVSLAVSAVNGCERCVKSHENSILELGTKEERVFESVRLASIVTSATKVL